MMHNMDGWFFWGHGGGIIFGWIIATIAIVIVVGWLVKPGTQSRSEAESPLEIAKKRYARGEISREDFEKLKKDLI